MKTPRIFRKAIALVLIFVIVLTYVPNVTAAENSISLSVQCGENTYALDLLQENGMWFADIDDLAAISGCSASTQAANNTASLYKSEPFVILYSVSMDACIAAEDTYYVPLQEASVAAGIRFHGDFPVCADVYRTPKQMLEEFDDIFYTPQYQITQLLLTDGYVLAESAAKIYAVLPFVGSGSLIGALSGEDTAERYKKAFTSILTNSSSFTDALSAISEFNDAFQENDKIVKAVADLTEKGGELYNLLVSKGVDVDLLNALAYEKGPYDSWEVFFEGWSEALSAVNFEYFLDLCSYYATVFDAEESLLIAMKRVFAQSDDENSRNAVSELFSARYADAFITAAEIYDGAIWDLAISEISDQAEELYYGGYASGTLLAAKGIDFIFKASDKSEAFIYFPIYASIQQDLYDYYRLHRDNTDANTMYDMRAVTMMYLKAAIAAYEYASFDDSLAATLKTAIDTLNRELANVLSYTEQEYAPSYTNDEFINWLDSQAGAIDTPTAPAPTNSSQAALSDLFDETYWHMSFGQSLGFNYSAKFSADGTFVARSDGSGAYQDGTYSYANGELTIVFDVDGFGHPSTIAFEGGPDSFTSLEKYPMQVGEEYYIISCLDGAPDHFEDGLSGQPESTGGTQGESSTESDPPAVTDPLASLNVGDVFTFGTYEQSSSSDEIEWIVLEKNSGKMLVISKYLLDCQPYHTQNDSVNWSTCSVRTWLNNTFYNTAFTAAEKEQILFTSDSDTRLSDNIFLLSVEEAELYFPTKSDRICRATNYAVEKDAYVNSSTGGSWWLLRTSCTDSHYVMSVDSDGTIDYEGGRVDSKRGTVRPAMWIKLGLTSGSTASSTLGDGEYYGYLQNWDSKHMTIELYEFNGWNEEYVFREFTETGTTKTLDISQSSIRLEGAWSDDGSEIECQSLDEALNTKIWGGGTTVKENCTNMIFFSVEDGIVTNVVILYAS